MHMIDTRPPNATSHQPARRYRLRAECAPFPRLRVVDISLGTELADWRGAVAESLLGCGLLPASLRAGVECYACKNLIQRLAMLAAAESMKPQADTRHQEPARPTPAQRDKDQRFSPLEHRLRRLDTRLTGEQRTVAELLFRHVGEHLSLCDVTCLLNLEDAPVSEERANAVLAELVDKRVIQRLPVSNGPTFYDVDTRPHLHVYDRQRNTLQDANVHGIVEARSSASVSFLSDASVAIQPNSSARFQ